MIDQIFHNFSLIVEGTVMLEVEGLVFYATGRSGRMDLFDWIEWKQGLQLLLIVYDGRRTSILLLVMSFFRERHGGKAQPRPPID